MPPLGYSRIKDAAAVLHGAVLCSAVCSALYCIHCTVLHYLYCNIRAALAVLFCTVLHCTALYCTALYCTVLFHTYMSSLSWADRDRAGSLGSHCLNSFVCGKEEEEEVEERAGKDRGEDRIGDRDRNRVWSRASREA